MSEPSEAGRSATDGLDRAVLTRSYGWLKYGVGPAIGAGAGGGAGVGAIFADPGLGVAVGAAIGVVAGVWISRRGRRHSAC